jgi:hypothetical protein
MLGIQILHNTSGAATDLSFLLKGLVQYKRVQR